MKNIPAHDLQQSVEKGGSFTFAKYIKKENKAKVNVPPVQGKKIILKNSMGKFLKLLLKAVRWLTCPTNEIVLNGQAVDVCTPVKNACCQREGACDVFKLPC